MEISNISSSPAMAAAVTQLQAISEVQMEIMKDIAASQQQMMELLQAAGIGTKVDVIA